MNGARGTPMNGADIIEIIGILVCIVGVGVMAASEVGITRTTKIRAYHLVEENKRGAASLLKIVENPPPYLNVVLLLTLVFTIGGTTIATDLATSMFHTAGEVDRHRRHDAAAVHLRGGHAQDVRDPAHRPPGAPRRAAHPRRSGGSSARSPSCSSSWPTRSRPAGACRRARTSPSRRSARWRTSRRTRTIEEEEADLIHSIFEFGDTIVREVMVPRPDIVAVDVIEVAPRRAGPVVRWGYSRVPVIRGDVDDIVGFVYAKDVLKAIYQGKTDMPLEQISRPAHFVPEVKKVAELLREMQQQKFHIAMVSDEHGSVTGLVSLEDLLEELVGEIADEYDVEQPQVEAARGRCVPGRRADADRRDQRAAGQAAPRTTNGTPSAA